MSLRGCVRIEQILAVKRFFPKMFFDEEKWIRNHHGWFCLHNERLSSKKARIKGLFLSFSHALACLKLDLGFSWSCHCHQSRMNAVVTDTMNGWRSQTLKKMQYRLYRLYNESLYPITVITLLGPLWICESVMRTN